MEVCRYFKAPGGCWYGKKCRFYHDASHVPDNQINPKICRYFGTLNGCRNGNKCRFLHIQETGSARVEEPLEGAQTCHDTLKDESSVRLKLSESDPKTPGSFPEEVAAREVSEAKPNDPPYTCGECKRVFTGAGAHRNLKAHYMKMLRKFDKSHVAFLKKSPDFNERSRCEFCKKNFHKARQNLEHIVEKVNSSKKPLDNHHKARLNEIVETFTDRDIGAITEDQCMWDLINSLTHGLTEVPFGTIVRLPLNDTIRHMELMNLMMLEEPDDDELQERSMNCGFTNGEAEELLCQGIMPWDDCAWAALDVLHGDDDY